MSHGLRHGIVLALGLLVGPILAGVAWADSIGPLNCGSCFGGSYTLEYLPPDDGSVTIIYTADLTGTMKDGTTDLTDIDAIAFKVVSNGPASRVTGGSLDLFTVDGLASNDWGTDFRVANQANGCFPNNPPGDWVCSQNVNGLDGGPEVGHVYQWTFTINYGGPLFTDPGQASIKADFSPGEGHLLSEHITLQERVPEPGTLTLLGTGLAGLGVARRLITRRRR